MIWDAVPWLEANFTKSNGLPEFFLEGDYPADKREQAEEEYKNTVKLLLDSTEDEVCKCWCEMTILSNFSGLELNRTKMYWRILIRDETSLNQEDNVRNIMFRHSTSIDFQKRPSPETEAAPNTRRKVTIDEPNEVAKLIKETAVNNLRKYDQSNDREKYFIVCGINNVVDLTDVKQGNQLNDLNEQLRRNLCDKEFDDLEYEQIGTLDEDLITLIRQKKFVNLNRTLYSHLGRATDLEFPVKKIISHIVETYVHYSNSLLPDVFDKLSEGSIVIKFWSTMIEALFSKTDLVVNWGDTISYGPEKTNRRIDLRILYNLDKVSNDVANGEFGKSVLESKYFHDKAKLLNNIIKITHDSSIRVALLLIQGLQADLYTIRLSENGLWTVDITLVMLINK
ncbi:hypothetical protein MFLAVUS_010306 [Mucor flavus]|uniref:Uncharacterized protein n=1 Tax=Mucor flavus TaxID=439312 RepID=A0ABP9ZCD4_9FUNG